MASTPCGARALHILEVRTRGLLVEARLNDIPVFTESAGRSRLFQAKCEPYLVTGENELRVRLRLSGSSAVDEEAREGGVVNAPHCRVRLVRLDPKATIEEAGAGDTAADPVPAAATALTAPPHDLVIYAWDSARDLLLPGRIFDAGPWFFAAESPAGSWSWEAAPTYQPAGEDPAEIRMLIGELWRAVAFRNADAVVHLTRVKTRELAIALGVNAGELETDQARYLVSLFTSPDWAAVPLEQDALRLEPAARGRLVEVRTVEGEAPIRGGDGARVFILRPMVAKIEGRWRIVR
jgi:hypothetical protein